VGTYVVPDFGFEVEGDCFALNYPKCPLYNIYLKNSFYNKIIPPKISINYNITKAE